MDGRVDSGLLDALGAIVGADRLTTSAAILDQHGRDESYHPPHAPEAVVFARSTEEVSRIVGACAARRVPMIAFGAGTSLEGHISALAGGVCIDLTQMNRLLAVHAADLDVVIEPGVTRKRLNEELRDTGLFFPVDPGADATLGGMAATRASGTNAVRYGTMRENVLALTAVLADGRVIRTGSRARKSAAGYDLTRLLVGSEGTLGIITELTLRLYGIPEAMSAAVCSFGSVEGAVESVIATIQGGIPVARIEFLDDAMMGAVNAYAKLDYPPVTTLFYEFHGTEAGVEEQAEMVQAIAAEHGGSHFQWATRTEDRDRLWSARHNAYYAAKAARANSKGLTGDVCVPISRLAESIAMARQEMKPLPFPTYIVGHVGDGNFHTLFLIDPNRPDELKAAKQVNDRIVERALALGGTCTGEHGVGIGKMPFLAAEHGEAALDAMRAIKRALDPHNLMNPGKIVVP